VLRLGRVTLVLGMLAISVARAGAEGDSETPTARAAQLRREAAALRSQGRAAEAIPRAREALRLGESTGGPTHPDVAESLHLLGLILRTTGDYAGARQCYERALAIREQVLEPTHPDVAESLSGLGKLLFEIGDYAGARGMYERALTLREEELGPANPRVASSLDDLGTVLKQTGDYASARWLYERALTLRERELGPNSLGAANSLNDLAGLFQTMGDYTAARPLYERALKIREKELGPTHPVVAQTLNDLAGLLRVIGDYGGARSLYGRALSIREHSEGSTAPIKTAETLNDLGNLFRTSGDNAAARPMYERALAIREQHLDPMHPDIADSLNSLAGLLRAAGDFAAARHLYERALAMRERKFGAMHPAVAESLNSLAGLLRAQKDDAAGRPLYERALAIREQSLGPKHPRVASSLVNLAGVLEATGDDQGARPLYARALAIARETRALAANWRAALGLGRLEEKAGRLDAALPLYREAVQIISQLSAQFGDEARSRFLEAGNKLEAYDALASALLRAHGQQPGMGYDREAWAVLETKRGWVAADALTGIDRQAPDRDAREKAEPMLAKQDQVAALESQIETEQSERPAEQTGEKIQNLTRLLARTKADFNDESERFLARYPEYTALVAKQRAVFPEDLAKYANRLPAGTLAVQYYSAAKALYTFVVDPGGLYEVKEQTITQAELYELIRIYRRHMETAASEPLPWEDDGSEVYRREVAPFKAVAVRLGQVLLDPLRVELEKHTDVVLFPNDLLMYLPIHALPWRRSGEQPRFLAETHRVRYATQHELPDVVMGGGSPNAHVVLVAVGNPDGSLPASSGEVRALGRLRAGAVVLEGAGATKDRLIGELKNQTSEFELHLATHGVLDGNAPALSYLVLAGSDDASRRLTLKEVMGLTLPIRLAVLSACETATPGEVAPGVALITLAKAFSTAGAQAIVAALWRVEEEATRDWMVALHRSLAAGESRASAVQAAQTAVRSRVRTAHPYYWAAFILIGAR